MAETFTYTFGVTPGAAAPPALRPHDLFATRIWQVRLDALMAHLPSWVDAVLAMRAANPQPAGRTNRQGWNSADMAVLEQPVFATARQAIHAACTRALAEMGASAIPFRLQSWVNLHDRGGFNFLHVHEGSLLSGSFYIKVPPGSGRFVFRDPRPGVVLGYVKGAVPNGYSDIHLTPEDGLLVLFPSWMEHYVEPHANDAPRIAIAFNAIEDSAR
ncbi:MAG: hypothetical protein JSS28_00320 [Proteobacteria bacterium]|nr:hypothetical protein [Pseudomonadota bacterium]